MKDSQLFGQIRDFILPPKFDDPEKNRRAQLLNFIAWSGFFMVCYELITRVIQGTDVLGSANFIL